MKRYIRRICMTALASLFIWQSVPGIPTYACDEDQTVSAIQVQKASIDQFFDWNIQNTGNGVYLVGAQGIRYGWGIDKTTGDLVYTAPGSETGISVNCIQDGAALGADGRMINSAELNPEENLVKSVAYENGERLIFMTDEELLSWENYYVRQYRLINEDISGVRKITGPQSRNGKWEVQSGNISEQRENCKALILQTYGAVTGCNRLSKIVNAVHKLQDTTYDDAYIYAPLDTAVSRKRMVCWQFARTTKTLLEDAGVQVECLVVQRIADGAFHTMLRWRDEDGKWHYTDPTAYVETGAEIACDLPYSVVQMTYQPAVSVKLNEKG